MKKNTLFGLLFAGLLMLGVSSAAQAELPNVAVVDIQAIVKTSLAGKDIEKQLKKKRSSLQKEISSREEKLRSAEKDLIKQKSTLDQAAFTKKRQAFEKDVIAAQKVVQKNKIVLEKGFAGGVSTLRTEVRKTISKISAERKLDIVLTQDAVVIAAQSMDITDDVIKALNAKVKSIKLNWSGK